MHNLDCTIERMVSRLRLAFPVRYAFKLKLNDCTVAVKTNSRQLVRNLTGYFRSFVTDHSGADIVITVHQAPPPDFDCDFTVKAPDRGKRKIKEEYADVGSQRIIRKRLTGMVFIFGNGEHLAIGPCEANANQVINFINNRYIEWQLKKGGLLGHAAAVAHNGKGIALAGFSGMGKSTLALRLLGRGLDFVSNDRLVISTGDDGITMHGVPKHPRVNPGTILNNPDIDKIIPEAQKKELEELAPEALWHLEDKYDVPIEEFYGINRFVLKAGMKGLVILNWQRNDAPTAFQPVDLRRRTDLLAAFMKETGLFFQPGPGTTNPGPENFLEILSGCVVVEITGGVDFDAAADYCLNFLNG